MNSPDTGLTVVVPAYNELDALAPVMKELVAIMEGAGRDFEIIVIDDGSIDGTSEIAAGFSDPVRTIRHEANEGYGSALKTGIRAARYPNVCTTDADGTYPNERIPDLFEHYLKNGCDMVVGARTGDNVSIPLIRRPAKWAIGKLANYMVNFRIPDINSGLRLFRRDLVKKMFRILPDGFSISTNVTMAMIFHGYKVDFLPIDYHARIGSSKIRPIHDTLNFIQLISKMGLFYAPARIFLPLSGILFLIAVGWALFTKYYLGQLADISTLVLVLTSFQVAVVGLLAELIIGRLPSSFEKD
jgi:glycosyltransferase involved in cell wall biosynthesis